MSSNMRDQPRRAQPGPELRSGAMRDRLFLLRPGFLDPARGDGRFFCPYCAQVVGFLAHFPEVRATLEIVELEFPRPRAPLVALVGEAHQGTPLLVLGDERDGDAALAQGVPIDVAGGHRFVEKTADILRYLAATRRVPLPHF
jgi:hypothetical protein